MVRYVGQPLTRKPTGLVSGVAIFGSDAWSVTTFGTSNELVRLPSRPRWGLPDGLAFDGER